MWKGETLRIKALILQQNILDGEIAYPSVYYHQTTRLAPMMTWWNVDEMDNWAIEQNGMPMPLKEWVLMGPDLRPKTLKNRNMVYNAIMRNWVNCQSVSAPGQSRLGSFLYLPGFVEVGKTSTFSRWKDLNLD